MAEHLETRTIEVPAALLQHVRDQKHPISKAARKEAHAYVQACPYNYDHASIALPANGLEPQPVIPIMDGFRCRNSNTSHSELGCTRQSQAGQFRPLHVRMDHNSRSGSGWTSYSQVGPVTAVASPVEPVTAVAVRLDHQPGWTRTSMYRGYL